MTTYFSQIGEWAMKRYPYCLALLKRRGWGSLDAFLIILDAAHGDRKALGTIGAMRRCEVSERRMADFADTRKRRSRLLTVPNSQQP